MSNKKSVILTILVLSIALTANAACESVVRDLPDMPVGHGEEITVGLTQNGFLANVVKVADILPAGFEYVSGSYTGSREELYYPGNNTLVMMLAGNGSHPEITVTYNVTTGSVAQINDGWFFGTYSGFAIEPVPGEVEGLVSGDATLTSDTTAPAIDSVTLNRTDVTDGDLILVTVDATDDVRIANVTADDVELTESGDDIWIGVIIADEGTHFVNVSATDTSGNVGWNNSTSYTTTDPDTADPIVNSVILNRTDVTDGDPILVTVDATDDVRVANVTADDVELTESGDDIWIGVIIAEDGTHFVNVSATDTSGNVGWNNSTSYTTDTDDQTYDLNGDEEITPVDALIALQMASGSCAPDGAADVNGDGRVTSLDALMLMQVAANNINI